jgi:hypothetical protein
MVNEASKTIKAYGRLEAEIILLRSALGRRLHVADSVTPNPGDEVELAGPRVQAREALEQ